MSAKAVKQELKEEIIDMSEDYEGRATAATTTWTPHKMLRNADDFEVSNVDVMDEFVPAIHMLNGGTINDSANFSLRMEDDEDSVLASNVTRTSVDMQNLSINGDETSCDSGVVPASSVETSAKTLNGISKRSKPRTRQSLRNETTNRNFTRSNIPGPSREEQSTVSTPVYRPVKTCIQKMPDMLKVVISPKQQEIKLRSSLLQQLLRKCCITCSTFYNLHGPEESCEQCGTALFCKCILCDAMVFVSVYGVSKHAMQFHNIEMPMIARPEPLETMGIKRLCVHHCKHCNNSCKVLRESLITCQNCKSKMGLKCLICKKTFETVEETLNHINATHHLECDETQFFLPSNKKELKNRPLKSPKTELITPKNSKRTRSLNESSDESIRQEVAELIEPNGQQLNDHVVDTFNLSKTTPAINSLSIENFTSSRRTAQKKRKISKPSVLKSAAEPPRITRKTTAAVVSPTEEKKLDTVAVASKMLRSSLKKTQTNDVPSDKLKMEQNESFNDQNLDSKKQLATFVKNTEAKNKATYSCTKCEFKSMGLTGINRHIRLTHRLSTVRRSEPAHLQITERESTGSRRSLQSLSSNSVDGKKKCLKCGKIYVKIIEHEKICSNSNLNIYQCPFCTYNSHSKLELKAHMTNSHFIDEVTEEDTNESNIDAEIICTACKDIRKDLITTYRAKCKLCNSSMTYRCIKCKTEFNSKRDFLKHARIEHRIKS